MITIPDALQVLTPGAEWVLRGNEYAGLEWLDTKQAKPTETEVKAEMVRLAQELPFKRCKEQAKQLIANTDWSVLGDVGLKNSAVFVTYRGILRGYIITPVADPEWPTEPQPIWE